MTKTQINQLITDNKKIFTQGTVMSEALLCELMAIEVPRRFTRRTYNKFMFAKLSAYCQLNRYLSQRGLVIAQRECGAEYHVLANDAIERQVTKLVRLGEDKLRNAEELQRGFVKYKGKWRKLTKAQQARVRDYQNDIRS